MEAQLTFIELLRRFYNFLFMALFLLSGGLFLYLAFRYYLFSSKKAEKIQEANKMIIYITLGLVLLVSSLFIPRLILNFLREEQTGTVPDVPIIRPTGTYQPISF